MWVNIVKGSALCSCTKALHWGSALSSFTKALHWGSALWKVRHFSHCAAVGTARVSGGRDLAVESWEERSVICSEGGAQRAPVSLVRARVRWIGLPRGEGSVGFS